MEQKYYFIAWQSNYIDKNLPTLGNSVINIHPIDWIIEMNHFQGPRIKYRIDFYMEITKELYERYYPENLIGKEINNGNRN